MIDLLDSFGLLAARLLIAAALTFTKFFGWNEVWIASGWLLLTGIAVSTIASLVTLRRYLKV